MLIARSLKVILLFILFLIPSILFAGQFKVTGVHDGDSIRASRHDIDIKVRLVGIDAPEMKRGKYKPGQPISQKAKKLLTRLVLNKQVFIKGYGSDQSNRILAVVYVGKKNINLEMIKAGLAEAYRGKPAHGFDPSPYRTAEAQAKSQKRGMWLQGDKYISPKDWRKMNK